MNKLQLAFIRIRDFFIELFCGLKEGHKYSKFKFFDEETLRYSKNAICLKCGKII